MLVSHLFTSSHRRTFGRTATVFGTLLSAAFFATLAIADAQQATSAPASRRARRSLVNEADAATLAAYRLTADRLDKFEATSRRTVEAMKKNPALREQARAAQAAGGAGGRTIDATASQLEKEHPDFAALIKGSGWSVRDYLLTSYALFTARTFSGVQQSQPGVALPAYVSAENLAFVRANQARIDAAFRTFEQEAERAENRRR